MRPRIAISCGLYGEERRIRPSITYAEAVWRVGGMPFYVPAAFTAEEWTAQVLGMADGVVFTGGGDVDPARYGGHPGPDLNDVVSLRDEIETAIIREAVGRDSPVLAICRGCQILNVAFGGTLFRDVSTQRPSSTQHNLDPKTCPEDEIAHPVELAPGSRLARAYGADRVLVNSMHHQAVDRLGPGLAPAGTAPDGLVEAVEATEGWTVGVQWHPERMIDRYPEHVRPFRGLVEAAAHHDRASVASS